MNHQQLESHPLPNAEHTVALTSPELDSVPSGAFALAGVAVGLLLAAWLLIYFFVFITRGTVG